MNLLAATASSVDTYGGEGGKIAAQTHEAGLPITGLDVLVLVGIALLLIVAGMAMARMQARGE